MTEEKESVRKVQEDYKMKMEDKQEDYKMKTEVKVNNNIDASECENVEYFEQDYEGDIDSKQLIKIDNGVKRKAEVDQETNVKKLSIRQIDRLEKMAMFRRELSVRQIEKLENMAMFRI